MQIAARMNRLGSESAFEVLARAKALEAQGKSVINLGIGQPDFATPDHVVEAAVKALRDGHHGYTPANGILPLREAVAADIAARRGVNVDPGRIVIVPGGKVTMATAIQMFGEPGGEILYPDPGFPIYESLVNFTGATAVGYPLLEQDGFAFRADDLLARITPNTRLLIVNSPANPTGGVAPAEEVAKLAAGLAAHPHVAIMADEIYSRLVLDDDKPYASFIPYTELHDRLIVLDGWSKTYAMTGWRLGWGLWPQSLAELATKLAINVHSCVNAPTQFAGIAALQGPQDAVEQMRQAFIRRRALTVQGLNALPGVSCIQPAGAFYAFPNISQTGYSARQLQDALLEEAGVATIAGTSFGRHGEGYLRFSFAADDAAISEALQRVGTWLAQGKAKI
ncbi:pyridoxal phosphate-dependent aminotransferase [Ferrovibrio sp.]|uniref:pyridoxal phosphate-dependent aminotransferase n=1 Tax=Ferrovibrio sp. TaxID=1917215 RepID=UPI001B67CB71|nr:pyridoxal phosphate-dependent aminotransferase [Ferrovibrio sp.]MBP7065256.1 pyridoxal phosphate-dependent aminotransferase [Ferrovibrio sp.]